METTSRGSPCPSWPQLPNGTARRVELPGSDLWYERSLSRGNSSAGHWTDGTFDDDPDSEGQWGDCAPEVVAPDVPMTWANDNDVDEESDMEQDCHAELITFSDTLKKVSVFEVAATPSQEIGTGRRTFHQLLLEIAAEHQRVLAQLQAKTEDRPKSPQGQDTDTPKQGDSAGEHALKVQIAASSQSGRWPTQRKFRGMTRVQTDGKRCSPFDINSESNGDLQTRTLTSQMKVHLANLLGWREAVAEAHTMFSLLNHMVISMEGFDVLSTVMIIANSVLYGVAANEAVVAALHGGHPDGFSQEFHWLTTLFSAWFSFELLIRMYISGLREYFWGDSWSWNWFDVLVVGVDVVQTTLEHVSLGAGGALDSLTVMRMLRILRISRAVRVLKLARICRELRMMVFSILRSGPALTWSLTLLFIFIYIFAVYFVQVVAYHVHGLGLDLTEDSSLTEDQRLLKEMFGNLLRAEYTLYQAVSGGLSWGEINRLLIQIDVIHGIMFCFFMFFTTFALLNIITGIFVETSINSAKSSQEEIAQEQMDATRTLLEEMRRFFESADVDASGSISLDEFEHYLERKEVKAYLNALGIEIDKAKGLFQLLDTDCSGEITVDEFTFGCMRLKGNAKSIDLATLMNHTRRINEQMRRFYEWTEEQFKGMHEFQIMVEHSLAPLHRGEVPQMDREWKTMEELDGVSTAS